MNSLANLIHSLITSKTALPDVSSPELSLQEQAALENLAPMLRLSPWDLVALLEQAATPLDWAASSRSGSKPAEA